MEERLILKSISELLGLNFFVRHYQRGYRWTDHQVKDLLNDIDGFSPKSIPESEEKTFYCLQPIVVKECNEKMKTENNLSGKWYEVIDGQQRLTTIFLLIHYANEMWVGKQKNTEFTIRYETRNGSTEFLEKLEVNSTDAVNIIKSNIDFYYITKAYETIHTWVKEYKDLNHKEFDNNDFQSKLKSHAKVIWYEVEELSDSIELFTRLNMGKIPLTNSELIKALFLSSSSFEKESSEDGIRRKMEISQMWDDIEQKLSDEDFWSFITNQKQDEFPTKIELLFDIIAKKQNKMDPLYTFLYFLGKSKDPEKPLWMLWLSIEQYYLTLCEWYKDKNYYHKIGFLITVGENLGELVQQSMDMQKKSFKDSLDGKIRKKVTSASKIEELSYDSNGDYQIIENLLLLFNIESILSSEVSTEYYPFKFHKHTQWSLEHIHAQNSESLDKTKKEQWIKWLEYHTNLIAEIVLEGTESVSLSEFKDLLDKIQQIDKEKLTWEKFNVLSKLISDKFSLQSEDLANDLHSISNLALLSQPDNAALNNSVFEVKRRELIGMDKKGNYIPLCTRRVFLKYYNNRPSTQQYYFWSKDDRKNYLMEIKNVLANYLTPTNEN